MVHQPRPNPDGCEAEVAQYSVEKIEMPSLMRNSHFFMETGGIYVIGTYCIDVEYAFH
jgi:hypothetical protein